MSKTKIVLRKALRDLAIATPMRRLILYHYPYNISPAALGYLTELVSETRDVPGSIVEVGCDKGSTTVFLNRHMDVEGIEKPYLCIDTFAGFTDDDVAFERESRGKQEKSYESFAANSEGWFRETMKLNDIHRVETIATDIKKFEFPEDFAISFALVDLDIYLPSADALPKIYAKLSPGGIAAVDDCHKRDHAYDGAHTAYLELVEQLGVEPEYRAKRLGIIRKP